LIPLTDSTAAGFRAQVIRMSTILDRIVANKRLEIAERRNRTPENALERKVASVPPPRNFAAALTRDGEMNVIAEVKKASPSAGVLRAHFDAVALAQTYARHGAAAVSVLTDAPFFQGSLEDLAAIRAAVTAPLLRKDFILDRYQLLEARLNGADAVLLIAEILSDDELRQLYRETYQLGMHALVEFYEADNLPRVVDCGARLIGINNRDLRSFETRLAHTLELAAQIPRDRCLVSESGIRTRDDVERLRAAGARAVLVGETLLRSPDVAATLCELRLAPEGSSP
jgi:indole-3-glycerol phosphate synthase